MKRLFSFLGDCCEVDYLEDPREGLRILLEGSHGSGLRWINVIKAQMAGICVVINQAKAAELREMM